MKALVFDGQLRLADLPKPSFEGKESLIRLLRAGICNTDLEITKGYFRFKGVLGHEFVGIVEASKSPSWVGKRVVGEINAACGQCEYCERNLQRHCPHRSVLGILNRDGAFREYLMLPEENLHLVPDSVSDEQAVFTEPIAAACEILDQVNIQASDRVAVLGDGKLGLLIAMVLSNHRSWTATEAREGKRQPAVSRLSLIGKHAVKMKVVEDLEIDTLLLPSAEKLGRTFDIVVEATGSPQGWNQALRLVKPRGTIVLKSTFHSQIAFNPAPIVVDEITMVGSRCGRFEPALELLGTKKINPIKLLHRTLPLHQALEAFELAQQSGVLKVVLSA